MATELKDTVILQTSDEEQFTVEKKVAIRSALIQSMLEGASRVLLSCFRDHATRCALHEFERVENWTSGEAERSPRA